MKDVLCCDKPRGAAVRFRNESGDSRDTRWRRPPGEAAPPDPEAMRAAVRAAEWAQARTGFTRYGT